MKLLRQYRRSAISKFPSGLGQRGAISAGCHAHLTAEYRGQMALVGEPGLLRDQREWLIGPAHQGLRALEPALRYVTLQPNSSRLLERATEVTGARTGDVG